jgi:hypothetical protein
VATLSIHEAFDVINERRETLSHGEGDPDDVVRRAELNYIESRLRDRLMRYRDQQDRELERRGKWYRLPPI